MEVIKVIVSTIISSLFIFVAVKADATDFHTSQYDGIWYTIRAIVENAITGKISCDWTVVKKLDGGEWDFFEVGRSIIDGEPHKTEGYGKIIGAKIHINYPSYNWTDVFTATSYNNGNEIIFHKESVQNYHVLLSRHTTVAAKTLAAMENHVKDVNHHVMDISHDGCMYNEN